MSVIKKSRFRLCCSSHPDVNNGIVRCKQRRLTYTTPPRKGIGCNETHFIQWRALKNRVVFLCSPHLFTTRRGWKKKEKQTNGIQIAKPMLEVEHLSKWGDSKDNETLFNDYYLSLTENILARGPFLEDLGRGGFTTTRARILRSPFPSFKDL